MSTAPSATQRLRQSLTAQINPTTMAEIKNRVAPAGGRPTSGQLAATLMFRNMAATLQIANIKRATAAQPAKPKTTAANRAALARRLANLNTSK